MKKLVSTQGLLFGHYENLSLSKAINERVNDKLEIIYDQCSRNGDIHISSELSYDLFDGLVTAITLSYTIDNPTPERLEDFRATCDSFYEVQGFIIDNDDTVPNVFLHATEIYDMASLIHALNFYTVSLESIMKAVDGRPARHFDDIEESEEEDDDLDEPFNVDKYGVGYSEDGKILKFCRFTFKETRYEVPDGVEEIEDGAFTACRHFLELSIPRSVRFIGDFLFGNGGVIVVRN
jgi:hypothetical protein